MRVVMGNEWPALRFEQACLIASTPPVWRAQAGCTCLCGSYQGVLSVGDEAATGLWWRRRGVGFVALVHADRRVLAISAHECPGEDAGSSPLEDGWGPLRELVAEAEALG